MRCYICDWSPHGDSLSFEAIISELPTYLIQEPNGHHICNVCNQASKDDYVTYDLQFGAANDNEPIDVEFEEVA
jgi:hypothetical protein